MVGLLVCKVNVDYRSEESLKAKITEIDAIINELMTIAIPTIQTGNVAEYELDTGQTRVRKKYNSISVVRVEIEQWEATRQMYVNKLNKSVGSYRLMNERNFKR